MLGSIFIGLSGMNAYSRGLRTISNNVANLNSIGFKASSVTFLDQFNPGSVGSRFYTGAPRHLGSGVRLADPTLDFGQGDLRQTGEDLDLAIQGDGFLVILDGDQTSYARTGSFGIDREGFIVLPSGGRLAGLNAGGTPTALRLDRQRVRQPEVTSRIDLSGIVNTSEATQSKTVTVYDSLGGAHTWTLKFEPSTSGPPSPGSERTWTVTVLDGDTEIGQHEIQFELGGGIRQNDLTFTVETPAGDAAPLSVEIAFSDDMQTLSGLSQIAAVADGHALATVNDIVVEDDGSVVLMFTDRSTETVGQIALANFGDVSRLEQAGDGLFQARGIDPTYHASGKNGVGKLVSGRLEASNVDLAQQFGELILVQRGFQASSQVVSVSNDMIQQLFGIRGQG